MKRVKVRRGVYRVGRYEIIHACDVVWEVYDGDDHIGSELTLKEACAFVSQLSN
jgi:hypothetical protein